MRFDQDSAKGQVWTPNEVAVRMVGLAYGALGKRPAVLLDPACGPATFFKAIIQHGIFPEELIGFDVDKHLADYSRNLSYPEEISLRIENRNYLEAHELSGCADLVIMNPPYIRHERINSADKKKYHNYVAENLGVQLDRRANLMSFFLFKGGIDLKEGGVLCAIVYDAIENTRYGKETLEYLTGFMDVVTFEQVSTPFEDTLIDAKIMVLRKTSRMITPKKLAIVKEPPTGWSKLGDLLETQRGTSLTLREALLASQDDKYVLRALPFIMKQSKHQGTVIKSADERAYIVDRNQDISPSIKKYLATRLGKLGREKVKIIHKSVRGSLLFNYYVRSKPRHFFNPKRLPASDNFYVSTPKHQFSRQVAWLLLNSSTFTNQIISAGRNQGNGLTKIQLFEYKGAVVPDWTTLTRAERNQISEAAKSLIQKNASIEEVRKKADRLVQKYFGNNLEQGP